MACQNNLLEMSGDMGEYSDGRGRVAHPPCRYHAAHGCALWARTGGSPWGLRTCPINRASRVAKASRNRQARTNIVLFLRRARYRPRSGKYAACSLPHARAGSVLGRSRAAGSQLISRVLGVRLRARASSWSWAAGQLGNRAGQRIPYLPYSFLPHAGLASHDTSTRHKRPLLNFRLRFGSPPPPAGLVGVGQPVHAVAAPHLLNASWEFMPHG
jgi:hypothetical protein